MIQNILLQHNYLPLALLKASAILLRMVFMVFSFSPSGLLSPCACDVKLCCSKYSSSASHLSNNLSSELLSQIKLCNVMQAIIICFSVRVGKLGIPFKICHFCFKTPKARSMKFQRDECKKLNISYFP
jgi:Na+(H+)/acetate symporter ActP